MKAPRRKMMMTSYPDSECSTESQALMLSILVEMEAHTPLNIASLHTPIKHPQVDNNDEMPTVAKPT